MAKKPTKKKSKKADDTAVELSTEIDDADVIEQKPIIPLLDAPKRGRKKRDDDAQVVKLAATRHLKCCERKLVSVRVRPRAPPTRRDD